MARLEFTDQSSGVTQVLDELQIMADKFILAKNQRLIQLGREKESRAVDAYKYLINRERGKVTEYEAAIGTVEQSLLDRGVELESVNDEYKSIDSEELLLAAGESSLSMLAKMLEDVKNQTSSYESLSRNALRVKRHIDMFDDAIKVGMDPALSGDLHKVDASDVALLSDKFTEKYEEYGPEIQQRLAMLQTEAGLAGLQEDYYAKVAREIKEKTDAVVAGQLDANLTIQALEPQKQQAQEGVTALLEQGDTVFRLREEFGLPMILRGELDSGIDRVTGDDLSNAQKADKETQRTDALARLGVILFPWITSPAHSIAAAEDIEGIVYESSGISPSTGKIVPPKYSRLISKLQILNAKYKEMPEGQRIEYKDDIQNLLGIDISNDNLIAQLIDFNEMAGRIDIKQAGEALKIFQSVSPESPGYESEPEDLLLQQFLEGGIK